MRAFFPYGSVKENQSRPPVDRRHSFATTLCAPAVQKAVACRRYVTKDKAEAS